MTKKSPAKRTQTRNQRFVAFLRGVNLGKRTAKSPQLIEAFSAVGLDNVQTFLASGNVVFDTGRKKSDTLRLEIERQLMETLGFETRVFLRSMGQVAAIAGANPFGLDAKQQAGFTVHVILLDNPVSALLKKGLVALRSDYDDFAFSGCEAWWLCRGPKISDSQLFQGNRLDKAIDVSNTMRNLRTMQRLHAKFGTD